jgi:hypothetical protein
MTPLSGRRIMKTQEKETLSERFSVGTLRLVNRTVVT